MEERSRALNEIPDMTNIKRGFFFQITILRRVGLPYFWVHNDEYKAIDYEELLLLILIIFLKIPYLLTYGAEPFLRSCQLWSPSRTPQHFIEHEGSIPC
jgi:hypothetical protein